MMAGAFVENGIPATFERVLVTLQDGAFQWEPVKAHGRNFPDVPAHIAAPADEAFQCHSIGAYRAASLLARAVVEASAKAKGVTRGTLAAKIAKMAEEGHMRSIIADSADEIRLLGNDMAHGDFAEAEVSVEDSEDVLGFMEDVLSEVFQLPNRVRRRQEARVPTSTEVAPEDTDDQRGTEMQAGRVINL